MSDMFFDTDSFDFSQLTDIVGLNDTPNTNQHDHLNSMGGVVDTVEDLGDNVPLDFNQDASDLYVPETHDNREDYAHLVDALPDDAYVSSLGMTIGEAKALKAEKERIDEQRDIMTQSFKNFEQETDNINHNLEASRHALAMHEEIQTKEYNKFYELAMRHAGPMGIIDENNPYASKLGAITGELNNIHRAQQDLANRTNDAMRSQKQKYLQAVQINELNVDREMRREIPDYNNLKSQIQDYATKEAGFSDWDFARFYSPKLVKTLHKAMQHDQAYARAQEKAKSMGASHARSMGSAKPAPADANVKKQQAQKALANMGTSRKANADAYAFLKD